MTGLSAYLSCRVAPAVIAWPTSIGFSGVAREDGKAAPLHGRSTGSGLYLVVDDVRDSYEKVIAAGATTVFEP
jgi:hypothetical protein